MISGVTTSEYGFCNTVEILSIHTIPAYLPATIQQNDMFGLDMLNY